MKNHFLNICRCIVGPEYGFTGEGNEQWYYTLAIIINLMLVWSLKTDIALIFTILAIIHYLTVCIYGYFDLCFSDVKYSVAYFVIHIILFIIAIFINFEWAIKTAILPIIAFLIAPDCTGDIIILGGGFGDNYSLLSNITVFVAFIFIDLLLPMNWLIQIAIIIGAIIIHPLIDYLQGLCITISDCTIDAYSNIKDA